jgi:hypothetical protein
MKLKHSTAILIFTRTPEAELEHKNFIPGTSSKNNKKIVRSLIQQTICTARKTLLPVFTIDETKQIGSTFGEKFANSFQKLFDEGYEKVIAIGNDCPDITPETLNKAIEELNRKDIVIGPSKDEGMYLVGLTREKFSFLSFSKLPWQNKGLLLEFIRQSQKSNLSLHLLSELIDINNFKDVQSYLKIGKIKNFFRKLLQKIVCQLTSVYFNYTAPNLVSTTIKSLVLRGPPRGPLYFQN